MNSNKFRTPTFAFIHIPKTGGTSIRNHLQKLNTGRDKSITTPSSPWGHRAAITVKRQVPDDCITFAVVRNTWSRIASLYKYSAPQQDFSQWICDMISGKIGISISQLYFITDSNISTSKINNNKKMVFKQHIYSDNIIVDYLLRFENLKQDWEYMCWVLNIPYTTLPHDNKTLAKDNMDYRDLYTLDNVECIEEHFSQEIEYFGYKFNKLVTK